MLELDCHLSKDGEVVVAHDQHLLRSTGVDKTIGELNYKDLPLVKTRLPIDFSPGKLNFISFFIRLFYIFTFFKQLKIYFRS